jgi:hypothetical protein
MTASIVRLSGADAYDLIYPSHLAKLSELNQETMHRAMMNSSRVWIGYIDDIAVATWGLIPPSFLSDTAYLWLYTDENIQPHQFVFIRNSQRAVAEMLSEFPTIVGHAEACASKSRRWLRWLGAEFGDPQGPLIPFTIRAK